MLILEFQVGDQSFGVDFQRIVEVTPLAKLRSVPHAPAYLAGLLQFRGQAVPVVDLNRLLGAVPTEPRLSTRIILVEPAKGRPLVGLRAEHVSDLKEARDGPTGSELSVPGAPYLGPVLETGGGLVQMLAVERILPGETGQGEGRI